MVVEWFNLLKSKRLPMIKNEKYIGYVRFIKKVLKDEGEPPAVRPLLTPLRV